MPAALSLRHAAHLAWSSSVNVVWHGNSLVQGVGASGGQTVAVQTAALAPMSGSGASMVSFGQSGFSWNDLAGSASSIDAAWVSGKTNVLILWETTNTVWNTGKTGAQSSADAQAYITARRAAHPWIILGITSIPRASAAADQAARNERNQRLDDADLIMKSSYLSLGFDAVCDVRQAGSPFAFNDYTVPSFDAISSLYTEGSGLQIHLTNAGYAIVAGYVAAALGRLPRVAY